MKKNAWLAIALVIIFSLMLFTVSCTKKEVQTQPVSATEPEVQKTADRSAEKDEDARLLEQLQEEQLRSEAAAREAAKTAFVKENVPFAFDSSALSDQARQILNSKADYLRTNPDVLVTVEGHCDDRGTNIYNLALGEQRAESVKSFLVSQGIGTNRLNTVSYGEERPIAMGHDEASWARNRRAQFVIN
jgi:peptidoglycan-associated lipoprotein